MENVEAGNDVRSAVGDVLAKWRNREESDTRDCDVMWEILAWRRDRMDSWTGMLDLEDDE